MSLSDSLIKSGNDSIRELFDYPIKHRFSSIIQLWDKLKTFIYEFRQNRNNPPSILDVTVIYHLLDEKQRIKIGYKNKEPVAFPIYRELIPLG